MIITPQIPVDSENLHYFVDYEDQRICISLHTMNLELFCFCMPSFCPHRIISLSLLVNRSFLIEEKCRFLSNFSQHTAEVELPGEFLLPKVRSVISMLKRTTRKPFQWWILDFIYIYVNVQEYKHTLKKKKEDFSVFKKNDKCFIHLKSSKSTIFCH